MKKNVLFVTFLMLVGLSISAQSKKQPVVTWTTAIQKVEPHNLPPAPYLAGNSLRQIVEVSFGGEMVSLKLSNQYNTDETEIIGVELAKALTQGESPAIDEATTTALTFNGSKQITMKPGEIVVSDPVKFHMTPRMDVAITIHFVIQAHVPLHISQKETPTISVRL